MKLILQSLGDNREGDIAHLLLHNKLWMPVQWHNQHMSPKQSSYTTKRNMQHYHYSQIF